MLHGLLVTWVALLVVSGAEVGAGGGPQAAPRQIGRYRLTPGPQGLEVRRASSKRAAWAAAVAGCVALLAALALAGGKGRLAPIAGVAGLGLLIFSAVILLDRTVWHANTASLVREGFAGRSSRWRSDEIAALEVRERRAGGSDSKQPRPELWEVRVRLRNGASAGPRLRLATRSEADALAAALGDALGRPVH